MIKYTLIVIVAVLSYIGCTISSIWAVIEFILYLVKDKPFNWNSLWLTIFFIILSVLMAVFTAAVAIYIKKKEQNNKNTSFEKRLEEIRKSRVRL